MKPKIINGRWLMTVPDSVADWDGGTGDYAARRGWEFERMESLHKHTYRGFTLFDVGTEHGWLAAVIAREFVGGENIVLFEPSPEFWSNIRLTWEHNNLEGPRSCWWGFVGDQDSPHAMDPVGWPKSPVVEVGGMPYRTLKDAGEIPTITLDSFAIVADIIPNGLNIDVEGAELLVLRGAECLLNERLRGLEHVWVSIHPDLMQSFGHSDEELHAFMASHAWIGEHLGTDHEQHWHFWRSF